MAIITWPDALMPGPGSGFGQRRYDLTFGSESTGAQQDRVLAPPRWQLSIVQPSVLRAAAAGQWQAVIISLRGRVNHLLCYNFGRPQPLGTYRGTLTLNANAALGATTASIAGGTVAGTLLRGDLVQIGTGLGTSQVVMCMADATADGAGVIGLTFEPPLRTAFTSGAVVAWDKPKTYFKQMASSSVWTYQAAAAPLTTGMGLDLLEHWT